MIYYSGEMSRKGTVRLASVKSYTQKFREETNSCLFARRRMGFQVSPVPALVPRLALLCNIALCHNCDSCAVRLKFPWTEQAQRNGFKLGFTHEGERTAESIGWSAFCHTKQKWAGLVAQCLQSETTLCFFCSSPCVAERERREFGGAGSTLERRGKTEPSFWGRFQRRSERAALVLRAANAQRHKGPWPKWTELRAALSRAGAASCTEGPTTSTR